MLMITPATIKTKFPEFSDISDATIQSYIDDSQYMFSPIAWGGKLDLGMSYYVASQLFNGVVNIDDTTQAAPYNNKSAGQASVGLAVEAIDARDADALFMSNKYGQFYIAIRNTLGLGMTSTVPATVLFASFL